jgi:drug/metabolite transporter (DMT)-like permease
MDYALILIPIVMFSIQTISFKDFNKNLMKNMDSYFLFNFLYFSLAVIIFIVFNREWEVIRPLTVLLATGFGLLFMTVILLYMKAMSLGPLSYSSLLFSMAMLVPIIFGAVFWDEPVRPIQLAGLALLVLTFLLASRASGDDKKPNIRWLLYCLAACIGNGLIMALSKAHQMTYTGQEIEEFLILGFGTAALVSLAIFLARRLRKKADLSKLRHMRFAIVVVLAGLTTGFGNLVALGLSGRIPAIVQFPSINGGFVILSSLLSYWLYKEKITRRALAGFVIGLAALVLLSLK